ncbi:MAG: hypothetical protein ACR2P8_15850 [Myxococcota bacterium]
MRCLLLILVLGLLPGCLGVWPNTAAQGPQMPKVEIGRSQAEREAAAARAPEQELRLRLERFADEFVDAVSEPLNLVLESQASLQRRRLALDMKYVYGSAAYTIASGAHAPVAVLDMVVFLSLTRDTLERFGVQAVGKRQTERLLLVFRAYEAKIWAIARTLISPEQEAKIREYLVEWRENNPERTYVENIRMGEFVDALDLEDRAAARGLVSSVQRATEAADQALELAERLTYFFQRAPLLWRMHAQLGFFEIVSQPEMERVLANADQISSSAENLSRNVDRLATLLIEGPQTPEEVALFENLEGGETRVRALMTDLRQTMEQADTLARTVDALAVRFNVGGPLAPGKRPFDIADYESTAAQVTTMTQELTTLVTNLNQLLASPNVQERLPLAVDTAQGRSEEFVRYLVLLGVVLVFSSITGTVVAVLGYRYLAARLDERLDKRRHA